MSLFRNHMIALNLYQATDEVFAKSTKALFKSVTFRLVDVADLSNIDSVPICLTPTFASSKICQELKALLKNSNQTAIKFILLKGNHPDGKNSC